MLDYSVHALWMKGAALAAPAPGLPHKGGQISLAADTPSAPIALTGLGVVFVYPTEKMRVDLRAQGDAAALDPAASPVVLEPGQPRPFTLEPGEWVLSWTPWSE